MARVYASNAGFRNPGMHGAMGLFGSQGRPGMKASPSLGSLSGNSLGIPEGAITRYGVGDDAPPAVVAPSTTSVVATGMTTQTKVLIGAGLFAAYWMFFKKKGR